MAKKSKRQVRRDISPSIEKSIADPTPVNRLAVFAPDYHFVIKDIRRVGVLASSFIIILIVLALFLH